MSALRGISGNARQPQQREHVHVVPFEGHGERDHVEFTDGCLRLERQDRRSGGGHLRELLLRRQEKSLADDVLFVIEQPVHRLEAEVRHADPVRVRKRQSKAQTMAVRLRDEANFFSEDLPCVFALFPGFHSIASRRPDWSAR